MSQKSVRFADPALQAGFTQIPNAILRDASLSAGARLTYAMLESFAWQADECWVGQEKLGNLVGVKDRQIRNYLGELEEAKLLEVKRQGLQKPNLYLLFGAGQDRSCSAGQDRSCSADQDRSCSADEEDTTKEDNNNLPKRFPKSKSVSKPSAPTQPAVVVSKKTAAIEEVWAGYVHWLKPRRTEMDPESRKLIVDALKVATPAELVACMEACARSDWHQKRGTEKNRPGGKYNKLPQIIKARRGRPETTRSRIEWWLDRLEAMNEGKSPSMDENAYVEQVRREQGLDG